MARWTGGLAAGYLVWLHALLLWRRIADQSLFEPAVALRWVGSALLVALAVRWLAGRSLFRGRRAAALWLAVLALHAGMPATGALDGAVADSGRLLLVLPVAAGVAGALEPLLRAVAATRAAAPSGASGAWIPAVAPAAAPGRSAGWSSELYGRPPPR